MTLAAPFGFPPMIAGMFRDLISWFAGLMETIVVLGAILLVGLAVAMIGFWVLVRTFRKLDPSPVGTEDGEEEDFDEHAGAQPVSAEPDDDSSPYES